MLSRASRFIFGLWSYLVFALIILIALPVAVIGYGLFGKKYEKGILNFYFKFLMKAFLMLVAVRLRFRAKQNFNLDRNYVIVSNHRSALDIAINAVAIPLPFKFLGKQEAAKVPLFGIILKRICILVDRSSEASRKASYKKMVAEMRDGISVFLYPEGTRNRSSEPLKNFYDGAFRLALEGNFPLLVQTNYDSRKLNSPFRTIDLSPGVIDVSFDVLEVTDDDDIESLKQKTNTIMLQRWYEMDSARRR